MEQYVGLDVSLKEISVCVISAKGDLVFEGKTAAEPEALIRIIRAQAPQAARIGLGDGRDFALAADSGVIAPTIPI